MSRCLFIAFALLAVVAAASCNKGNRSEAGGAFARMPASPAASDPAPQSAAPTETLDYQSPTEEAIGKADMLGAQGDSLAAQAGTATPEQRRVVEDSLKKQLALKQCTVDAAKDQIKGALFPKPISYKQTVDKVLGKLLATGEEVAEKTADSVVITLISQIEALQAAQKKEAELAKNTDSSGRVLEKIENQLPPALEAAKAVAGDWQSVREVDEAGTMEINHSDRYYEKLAFAGETLTWIIYRDGSEQVRSDYKFSFRGGDLELRYPNGSPYHTKDQGGALRVMVNPLQKDEIYLKTPGVERMKVFKSLGAG